MQTKKIILLATLLSGIIPTPAWPADLSEIEKLKQQLRQLETGFQERILPG